MSELSKEDKQYEKDFMRLMDEKWGRRLMWQWLSDCGVFRNSFTGNSQTFFNEGQRNVGLKMLNEINSLCPDKYMLMTKENVEQKS
jgi:hypothetical protein